MTALAVEFRGLSKSFHGVVANAGIDLKINKGTIHAIIGENGAGKSTAMKILYGTYQPDEGDILIHGKSWGGRGRPWSTPSEAIQAGIGMVHQHFMLAGPFTSLDNLILGAEPFAACWKWLPSFLRPVDRQGVGKKLDHLATQYGMQLNWDAQVETLSVGVQQRIEILKLLYRDADILILDEPTAVLTPSEVVELFNNLRKLAQQGKTIIIITHKLKEVMKVADRVTVFRGGSVVGERNIKDTNVEDLASLMVGRKMNFQVEATQSKPLRGPVVEIKGVTLEAPSGGQKKLQDIHFSICGGEIVGISGVEGNGQADLLQLLLHPKDHLSRLKGKIEILKQDIRELTADQVRALGVGVIPDDRLRDALLLDRPVYENFLLGLQRRKSFGRKGFISIKSLIKATRSAMDEFDIRPRSIHNRSGGLSGGNQQKLVIAREFKNALNF